MAIRHVAWIRFNDDVPQERIDAHFEACRALVGQIPELDNLECGPNITDRAGDLTHCVICSFSDMAALDAYNNHPGYKPVGAALVADVADLKVMDVEV